MIACVSRIDLNVIFYRNRLLIRNLNGVFFGRLRRFDRFGRLLICGLTILLSGCDFEDKPLTEGQRKEACVSSYMERFLISIVEGPETDDFFSVVKNENTYFSMVTAGSFDARAVLYLSLAPQGPWRRDWGGARGDRRVAGRVRARGTLK